MGSRLRYEFSRLGDGASAGIADTYPELPQTGSNVIGAPIYDLTELIDQPDEVTISFGLNPDEEDETNNLSSIPLTRAISTSLEVFNEASTYIRDWLIYHPDAAINSVLVQITDVECDDKDMGEWTVDTTNLDWCEDGECRTTLRLVEYTPELNCLQNTMIWDNHRGWFPEDGFIVGNDTITGLPLDPYMHPRYRYCDDIKPQALQNFIFVIAQTLAMALTNLTAVILAITGAIQDLINAVFGSGTADFADELEDQINDLIGDIFEQLLGCGRLHPSPFVRNYFINACSKCGIEFESNIFNEPDTGANGGIYYNTNHHFAREIRGVKEDSTKGWIPPNAPNYTVPTYAFSLAKMFNAKYMLDGTVFKFHKKDRFPDTIVFDFTGSDKDYILGAICYSSNTEDKRPQSIQMKFAQDPNDNAGNEALHRYEDHHVWTTDNNRYKGVREIQIDDYSAARFTNDGIDQKLIFKQLDNQDFWNDAIMLLEKDVTTKSKLILWDGISEYQDAQAFRRDADTYNESGWTTEYIYDHSEIGYSIYNDPLLFHAEGNSFGLTPNLFDLYLIDDPTLGSLKELQWNVRLELCCAVLDRIVEVTPDGLTAHLDYLVQLNATDKGAIQGVNIVYGDGDDKMYIELIGTIKYSV